MMAVWALSMQVGGWARERMHALKIVMRSQNKSAQVCGMVACVQTVCRLQAKHRVKLGMRCSADRGMQAWGMVPGS